VGRVLPRLYGHLIKAHNGPGGCHDTTTTVFSGVQARGGGDARHPGGECEPAKVLGEVKKSVEWRPFVQMIAHSLGTVFEYR
jgi:hypothetical protein